mgnify:FL=1
MNKLILELYISVISSVLGINLKDIKKVINKGKLKDAGKLEITESIDDVSKKLEDSKEIIETALLEIEKQKELFIQMKKEAEISQQISSMNQEQVTALNEILKNTLDKQEKKAFPKNLLWNLFFCVLSAVLGFVLGRYF